MRVGWPTTGRALLLLLLLLLLHLLLLLPADVASGQERPSGLEVGGLPALGYDADEGFGYGLLAEIYQYGDGSRPPYEWTLQPRAYLTSKGRRDVVVFFDAPGLLPGWRVNGYLGFERRVSTPYYGLGNASAYDPSLEDPSGADPHYYAFGRLRRIGRVDLQRRLGSGPMRALFGLGLSSSEVDPVPRDEGSTLYAGETGPELQSFWTNFVRAGLVWDTRDRETGPRRGVWSEAIVQWVDESLGADVGFTRWTLIDRRYFPIGERLVFAHRWLLQSVSGEAPVEQLQRVETSFREGEGLGGSSSVRGVLKNRYTGKGMVVWNAELRWRVLDFRLIGRSFHIAASTFLDQGRVWSDGVQLNEVLRGLHRGYGGGLHGGMGESFIASLYAGTSAETGLQAYIGLGYLY